MSLAVSGGRRTALELYAGTGVWAAAMQRQNFHVVYHDIFWGQNDVILPSNQARYAALDVDVTHHGLECHTFSVAANGKYRSKDFLQGYLRNHPRWTRKRSIIAKQGNAMARFTLDDFERKLVAGKLCSVEHPAGSLFWNLRRTMRLLGHPHVEFVPICYCAYGRNYKKNTRLMVANWSGAQQLASKCTCPEKHPEVLMGSKTAKAAEYPPQLMAKWASLLSQHFSSM